MAERAVAIVTGADSGIGKATAVELARAGHDLGLTWHEDEEGIEGAAEECRALGARVELRPVDLTDLPEGADVVDDLAEELGRLDVLVNNAGTGVDAPFLEQGFDDLR